MEIESAAFRSSPKELALLTLITLILSSTTEEGHANTLRSEFCIRYRQIIYEYSLRVSQRNFGRSPEWKNVCEDIVQETFIHAVYNLHTFKIEPGWSDKVLNNRIVGWLNSIAEHKLFDHYNSERGDDQGLDVAAFNYDIKRGLNRAKTADAADIYKIERPILEAAMQQLPEREFDVFYTYLKYGCLYGKKHLPDGILHQMCSKWEITESYARLIKSRTFDKLRKLCAEQKTKAA